MMIRLRKPLDHIGQTTVDHLREKVKEGSFATGSLADSFRFTVEEHTEGATLSIFADTSFVYVENGRRAGAKMPPADPLKAWMVAKGIEESALYPIRLHIAEFGIKPKRYLSEWLKNNSAGWTELLGSAFVVDVTSQITDRWKDIHATPIPA